jgi:nucleotide-binding universal stress UspA family protein
MFKTIIVGVDGRVGGRDALALAGRLALLAGGDLVAVRVLPFDYYVTRAGSPPYASLAEHDATNQLEADLTAAGLTARTRVMADTSPARALQRAAEKEAADLIVVGSTRRGRLGRVLAGDDAAATLHGSSCPVAVAPRGLEDQAWSRVRHIGVGYDGRPESRQAFALAAALARECGASITVRSVVGTPLPYADAAAYDEEWLSRAQAMATDEQHEVLAGAGVEANGDVVVGAPVEELVELSRRVELLVLGSRAWGPVRRILVGSTAGALTREAHCPLLVLPRGAATGQPGERDRGSVTAETPAAA